MKSFYIIKFSDSAIPAIADISCFDDVARVYYIHRINVPVKKRRSHYGSELLRQILADADMEHAILTLDIHPTGNLDYSQLAAWYERYGFVLNTDDSIEATYVRYPKKEQS